MDLKWNIEKIRQGAPLFALGAIPLLAIMGNAPADIGLVLSVIIFLTTEEKSYKHLLQDRFIQVSVAFWVWIMTCSALSSFPNHSFQDSIPWIRFPIYAFALSIWLSKSDARYLNVFISAISIATLIELSVMCAQFIDQRIQNEIIEVGAARLTGTFSKLMAGWYIVSFCLILVLELFERLEVKEIGATRKTFYLFTIIACSVGMVATGEVVNSFAYFSIVTIYLILKSLHNFEKSKKYLLIFVLLLACSLTIIALDQALLNRLMFSLSHRLPWQENSDYFSPIRAGLEFAKNNLLFGIGPKNTFLYCEDLVRRGEFDIIKTLGVNKCPWHPHNIYIQVAAETGLIGLAFFSTIVIYLLKKCFDFLKDSNYRNAISFAIIFINFFPLQSYSQAFGQSRNFYLWSIVGYAMSKLYCQKFQKIIV